MKVARTTTADIRRVLPRIAGKRGVGARLRECHRLIDDDRGPRLQLFNAPLQFSNALFPFQSGNPIFCLTSRSCAPWMLKPYSIEKPSLFIQTRASSPF